MLSSTPMRILILIFLLIQPLTAFAGDPLKISAQPWTPWIIKEKGRYTGIAVEICREAIRRSGHTSIVVEMPQKRRDLVEWGKSVDIEPGCERSWRIHHEAVSVYTDPYIQTRNVIVVRKGTHSGTGSLLEFYGTTIGANLGYYYTDGLSRAFDQGLIHRDDCGAGHNLISKLVNRRLNAIVSDTYEWKYWMKRLNQDLSGYLEAYRFSHMNQLSIRLHKDRAGLVPALNQALEQMKADRTISKIVRQFLDEEIVLPHKTVSCPTGQNPDSTPNSNS